jgi:hypothetical protein
VLAAEAAGTTNGNALSQPSQSAPPTRTHRPTDGCAGSHRSG